MARGRRLRQWTIGVAGATSTVHSPGAAASASRSSVRARSCQRPDHERVESLVGAEGRSDLGLPLGLHADGARLGSPRRSKWRGSRRAAPGRSPRPWPAASRRRRRPRPARSRRPAAVARRGPRGAAATLSPSRRAELRGRPVEQDAVVERRRRARTSRAPSAARTSRTPGSAARSSASASRIVVSGACERPAPTPSSSRDAVEPERVDRGGDRRRACGGRAPRPRSRARGRGRRRRSAASVARPSAVGWSVDHMRCVAELGAAGGERRGDLRRPGRRRRRSRGRASASPPSPAAPRIRCGGSAGTCPRAGPGPAYSRRRRPSAGRWGRASSGCRRRRRSARPRTRARGGRSSARGRPGADR